MIAFLYRVVSSELLEVVKYMLRKSRNQPLHNLDTSETPLLIACRKGLHDIAEVLLDHSPKILFISDVRNQLSPLHVACSRGDAKMVELILNAIKRHIDSLGPDSDADVSLDFRDELGRTPLYNACYYGYFKVARLLIDFQRENSNCVSFNVNAAVKVSQRTPLHVAVRKGSLEIVRLLLTVKNIDINPEGRPSGRTQKKLVDIYQKGKHGKSSVLSEKQENIIKEEEEEAMEDDSVFDGGGLPASTPELPMSPPGTRTPEPLTSSSSSLPGSSTPGSNPRTGSNPRSSAASHIDDSIGFIAPSPSALKDRRVSGGLSKLPKIPTSRSYSTVLPTKRDKKNGSLGEDVDISPLEEGTKKKRSQTDAEGLEPGETNLKVFENQRTGRLEFQLKDVQEAGVGCTDFDLLFVTPLAEACACLHTVITKLLLLHGARDDKGLACRIAHLINRPDLVKLILSFHVVLRDTMEEVEGFMEVIPQLELNWSHMKLPRCEGKWVGEEAEFCPLSKDQDGEGEENYASHSSELCNTLIAGPPVKLGFDAVVGVNLDNNQLQGVPVELFRLPNIIRLNVSGNKVAKLPTGLKQPSKNSGSNLHKEFESIGWACPALTVLNVAKNELTHLPACVWTLPNLTKLICSKNKLETLLPESGPSPEEDDLSLTLETVNISHNALKGIISRFLFELPQLRILNLSDNAIEELPETLWGCESLQELNVAGNHLSSLPWCEPEVVYRSTLPRGTYSHPAHIQQADQVLVGRAMVKAPKVERNKSLYNRAPSTIRPLNTAQEVSVSLTAEQCEYSALRKLNLSRNKFPSFPEALPCFAPNLVELDVSKNPLKELDIQFLPHLLKKFMAKGCQIERMGTVITKSHQTQVCTLYICCCGGGGGGGGTL